MENLFVSETMFEELEGLSEIADVEADELLDSMPWLSSDFLDSSNIMNDDYVFCGELNLRCLSSTNDILLSTCNRMEEDDSATGLRYDQEIDQDLARLVNPNLAMAADQEPPESSDPVAVHTDYAAIEEETAVEDNDAVTRRPSLSNRLSISSQSPTVLHSIQSSSAAQQQQPTYVLTYKPAAKSLLKSTVLTAVGATPGQGPLKISGTVMSNIPKVQIRLAPPQARTNVTFRSQDNTRGEGSFPLSPPNSDSDGSVSPLRTTDTRICIGQKSWTQSFHSQKQKSTIHISSLTNSMHSGGILILTEEEERTLISEGYPVPTKLPLTKQEEKILKKIQRKIKNKMSAQESRRKKKDYIESLEKRLEASNQENCHLKKKLEKLEYGNRTLSSQIDQLRRVVQSTTSAKASTCVMVFVLFFAVFLGAWNPTGFVPLDRLSSWYSPSGQANRILSSGSHLPTGPIPIGNKPLDDYNTPNVKSRVLLSVSDDQDDASSDTCHSGSGFFNWLSSLDYAGRRSRDYCESDAHPTTVAASSIPPPDLKAIGTERYPFLPENDTDRTDFVEEAQEYVVRSGVYVASSEFVPVSGPKEYVVQTGVNVSYASSEFVSVSEPKEAQEYVVRSSVNVSYASSEFVPVSEPKEAQEYVVQTGVNVSYASSEFASVSEPKEAQEYIVQTGVNIKYSSSEFIKVEAIVDKTM